MLIRTPVQPSTEFNWLHRGFGDAISDAGQVTSLGGSLASGVVGAAVPAGLVSASTASIAIPIIGVGVAGVMVALALIRNSGCGQTCIVASNDANKIEPLLEANLDGYFKGPRTAASKAQALQNFDEIWNALYQACSNPALGDAGKRCISDRQAGSCKWRQTDAGYAKHPYPGVPKPGECWDWFSGYRAPIANDAPTAAVALSDLGITGDLSTLFSSSGFSLSSLLIPAALLAGLYVVSTS